MNELVRHRGSKVVIEHCVVGSNLNLVQVRGFAPMDLLADISSPDVFDQETNPLGTQRDLTPAHAREASSYAIESGEADAETDPRAFPDVILNVRDEEVLEILVGEKAVQIKSTVTAEATEGLVTLEIDVDSLEFPQKESSPQISRLDGNHRLSGVPPIRDRGNELYPTIPFAMFIGLIPDQERKLFADINGTQKKMNTSHLSQIRIQLDGDKLLLDYKSRSLWFAKKLIDRNRGGVFAELVFQGGAKKGVKQAKGFVPPLTLANLKSMLMETLKKLDAEYNGAISSDLIDKALKDDKQAMKTIEEKSDVFLQLIERFWQAVQKVYPEAWEDHKKRTYVLFQSVGTIALSRFGGDLIQELMNSGKVELEDFVDKLTVLRSSGINLQKANYAGLAGLAGANEIYNRIYQVYKDPTAFNQIAHKLLEEKKSKLDEE